jgi:hypothetical protein
MTFHKGSIRRCLLWLRNCDRSLAHRRRAAYSCGDRNPLACPSSSQTRAVAACPACGNENPDGFQFCGFCAAPLSERVSGAPLEERKVVSVLFCDLVGFTAASEAVDPEDVRARLRPEFRSRRMR